MTPENMFLTILVYLIMGFIISSLAYVSNKILNKDYVKGMFLYIWIFWFLALTVYIMETIKNKYFQFLDRLAEKFKNKNY